jgi:NAD(P)H-hydrate epimerase
VPARGGAETTYSSSVLVVGGSRGLSGAAVLAARAAFRADAGYVALAAPSSALPVLETLVVEAVKLPCAEDEDGRLLPAAAEAILERAERSRAVALGPGLGRSDGTKELVRVLLRELRPPVVLDADGLWKLEPVERAGPLVLTPHEGELAGLLGVEAEWVRAHRLAAVRRGAEQFGCVCLLKGWDTLVAAPGEGVLVSGHGGGQLATAGTGDVLTGVLAAFLAKGLEPRIAAAAAAAAHGLASQRAPHRRGLVAGDVAEALPAVLEAAAAR